MGRFPPDLEGSSHVTCLSADLPDVQSLAPYSLAFPSLGTVNKGLDFSKMLSLP